MRGPDRGGRRDAERRPEDGRGARAPEAPRGGSEERRDARREEPRREAGRHPALFEYVLVTPRGCIAADVISGPFPLKWHRIDDVRLLRPGLYLRHPGGLQLVSRELSFDRAVLYVLWEDPDAVYPLRERTIRVGLHAGFLIPSPLDEGPRWIPIHCGVAATPEELEQGLLSSAVAPSAAPAFRARLHFDGESLLVSSEPGFDEAAGAVALRETLFSLASHPEAPDSGSRLCRLMLLENGHGVQRYGLTLSFADEATRARSVDELLPVLAPKLAPLLSALRAMWREGVGIDGVDQRPYVRTVARLLDSLLRGEAYGERGSELALATCWIAGLFGPRPDRERVQPARTLFLLCRVLRRLGGKLDLLDHPDTHLPRFPLDRHAADEVALALSHFPRVESNLERLIRALAIAEAGWDILRPSLNHLRPYRIVYPMVRTFPVGARTLSGRFDFVLTAWSFRALDPGEARADQEHLAANLLTESPSVAAVRALARAGATHAHWHAPLCTVLSDDPHPIPRLVAHLLRAETEDVIRRCRETGSVRRLSREKLYEAIAAAEVILARAERDPEPAPEAGFPVPAPDFEASPSAPVRAHFMYWRMYCRASTPQAHGSQGEFLSASVGALGHLGPRRQTEWLALARNWLRGDAVRRERGATWVAPLTALLDAPGGPGVELGEIDGERLEHLMACLGELSPPAWLDAFRRLLGSRPVQDLGRIVDQPRRFGWGTEFAQHELFAAVHARLTAEVAPTAAGARIEWVRTAADRGRHAASVRWFLDARAWPEFADAPAFREWFATRGLLAVSRPADAQIELLELATRLLPDSEMDLLMKALGERTSWPPDEQLRLLMGAGRWQAAAEYMHAAGVGTRAQGEQVVGSLCDAAESGEGLRRAALALHDARARAGSELPDAARWVRRALGAYRPHRALPDGAAAALDAWRLTGLDPEEPGTHELLQRVMRWALDTSDWRFASFVGWAVEVAVAEEHAGALLDAFDAGRDPAELRERLSRAGFPAAVSGIEQALLSAGDGHGAARLIRSFLEKGTESRVIAALVARTVAAAVQRSGRSAFVCAAVAQRASELAEALAGSTRAPDEAGVETATAEPRVTELAGVSAAGAWDSDARLPAEAGEDHRTGGESEEHLDATDGATTAPGSEGDAVSASGPVAELDASESKGASPPAPDGGNPGAEFMEVATAIDSDVSPWVEKESRSHAAEPQGPDAKVPRPAVPKKEGRREKLRAQLAHRLVLTVRHELETWAEIMRALASSEGEIPWLLVRRLGEHTPFRMELRRRLFGTVRAIAGAASMRVDDPRRLLHTDHAAHAEVECDPLDFASLLAVLVELRALHGLRNSFELQRRSLILWLDAPRQRAGQDGGADPASAGSDGEQADPAPMSFHEPGPESIDDREGDPGIPQDAPPSGEAGGVDAVAPEAAGIERPTEEESSADADGNSAAAAAEAEVAPMLRRRRDRRGRGRDEGRSSRGDSREGGTSELAELLRDGLRPEATEEARRAAFGNPAVPLLVGKLLARNPALRFRVLTEHGRSSVDLAWREWGR